jgi:hypothetical protein
MTMLPMRRSVKLPLPLYSQNILKYSLLIPWLLHVLFLYGMHTVLCCLQKVTNWDSHTTNNQEELFLFDYLLCDYPKLYFFMSYSSYPFYNKYVIMSTYCEGLHYVIFSIFLVVNMFSLRYYAEIGSNFQLSLITQYLVILSIHFKTNCTFVRIHFTWSTWKIIIPNWPCTKLYWFKYG